MLKQTPKNHKKWHNTPVVLCWHEKKNESNKRPWISFRPIRSDGPYRKPSCLLWEAPVCEKHISKPDPNETKKYHVMWMPLHDSMPSFMNFRWVLDLLELKNQVSQCLRPSDGSRVFEIHSQFLHGPKNAPKDTYLIFLPIYMHWSMCM